MKNFITGAPYTGTNVQALEQAAFERGFTNPYWLTFRQAVAKGLSVRGQTGTKIIRIALKNLPDENTGKIRKIKVKKTYTVFNIEQCTALTDETETVE